MHKSRITGEQKKKLLTAVSLVGDQHHFLHTARVTPQLALGAVTPAVAAAHRRRHLRIKPTKHHTKCLEMNTHALQNQNTTSNFVILVSYVLVQK
jgi:hypothetical protein